MNEFVSYLNSLHNATASNENALAESQVNSKYYEKIRVERNVGKYLISKVNGDKPCTILLTGHAGDGKTSLIIQVLRYFNLLPEGKMLEKYEYVKLPNRKLLYVKDMSELTEQEQDQYLASALEAPQHGDSAILISNTGPLINSLKRYFTNSSKYTDDVIKLEMMLLDQMDTNSCQNLVIAHCDFQIINIARLDNVTFVPKIIENMCQDELWHECTQCDHCDDCPIYFNYKCVSYEKNRVTNFCVNFYRWLYENDKRITIRQILSQFSYAMTGGLECRQAKKISAVPTTKFDYNFANMFFGFKGAQSLQPGQQIKGIRELNNLKTDEKSLSVDYRLFVKNNFLCFPEILRKVVKEYWEHFLNQYSQNIDSSEHETQLSIATRRAIRRFYLVYSTVAEEEYNKLIDEVYSPIYSRYLKLISSEIGIQLKNDLHSIIVNALYQLFVGLPKPSNSKKLYLTLRRENMGVQSVQMLQGELDTKDILLKQSTSSNLFNEDNVMYNLQLSTKQMNQPFNITLPLLDYFNKIAEGSVSTKLNPALSYGIDKLQSNLLAAHREVTDEIRLLVNTVEGPVIINCYFDDDYLNVYE